MSQIFLFCPNCLKDDGLHNNIKFEDDIHYSVIYCEYCDKEFDISDMGYVEN